MMRRSICMFTAVVVLCCHTAMAQKKKGDEKGISKPPGCICWTTKDKDTKVEYFLVPIECIDPEVHKRCRTLVREDADHGFMFFVVIINNKKGKEPVKFSAYGGDAHFYYNPPKKNEKDKTEKTPDPKKFNLISLKNYFAEKRSNADKVGYKRIQEMLKTNLTVAPGSYGWSLACIRDGFIFDLKSRRPNRVTWAIPGALPVDMKVKKFSKSLLKKADVKFFDDK